MCVCASVHIPAEVLAHWRSSGCSTWCTSGSMKYLRLQGCGGHAITLHLPPFRLRLNGGCSLWLSALSAFICLSSSFLTSLLPCYFTNPHTHPGRRAETGRRPPLPPLCVPMRAGPCLSNRGRCRGGAQLCRPHTQACRSLPGAFAALQKLGKELHMARMCKRVCVCVQLCSRSTVEPQDVWDGSGAQHPTLPFSVAASSQGPWCPHTAWPCGLDAHSVPLEVKGRVG